MAINYLLAADAAIVLDYRGTNQTVVSGINRLSLPGGTRQVVEMDEFRNEFARQFNGAGKYNDITFGGNYLTNDTLGQDVLRAAWMSNRRFIGTELMCFLNYDDFFTTDLANDPATAMQVNSVGSGEAGKNDAFKLDGKFLPNGRLAIYSSHLIAPEGEATIQLDATGTPKIVHTGDGFVDAGFVVGQTIMIIGSANNDGVAALATSVTAGEIELDVKVGTLVTEAATNNIEIHGGGF